MDTKFEEESPEDFNHFLSSNEVWAITFVVDLEGAVNSLSEYKFM